MHSSAGTLWNQLSLFNHIIQCACFTWSIYVILSEHVTSPNGFCRNSLLGLAFFFSDACSSKGSDSGPRSLGATCLPCVLCAKWNMTRQWLPVIALIDCGESMIISLAPLWVTYHDCAHISLLWRPSATPGWFVPTPCSPPYPTFSHPQLWTVKAGVRPGY